MRFDPLVFALLALASCTIIVDDDEPLSTSFGEETAPAEEESGDVEEKLPGEFVCSAPSDADYFTLELECFSARHTTCKVGDFLSDSSFLEGTACCMSEWEGAGCMTVAVTFCDGTPSECPNGTFSHTPCPDGLIAVCDFGYE
jgi:hypothetical protein